MTEDAPSSWAEFPLVTGMMVFERPRQYRAAIYSISSFCRQSWPNKELVIFNSTTVRLISTWGSFRDAIPVHEIRMRRLPHDLMLTLCAANANGEWCASWHPDCVYDPAYLTLHMEHRNKQRLVLLKHKRVYSLSQKSMAVASGEPTLCWSFYRHFEVDFSKPLPGQFSDVTELDNPASLITKFAREIC